MALGCLKTLSKSEFKSVIREIRQAKKNNSFDSTNIVVLNNAKYNTNISLPSQKNIIFFIKLLYKNG